MKHDTKLFILAVALLTAVIFQAHNVLAQGTYSCVLDADDGCVLNDDNSCAEGYFPGSCEGDTGGECTGSTRQCINAPPLAEKVNNLYNWALGAGALLALGIFIYAGVRYAASAGSSSAMGDARKWMSAALGGLAILFGSYLFMKTINPDLLTLEDPTTLQNESREAQETNLTLPGGEPLPTTGSNPNDQICDGRVLSGTTGDQCVAVCGNCGGSAACLDALGYEQVSSANITCQSYCGSTGRTVIDTQPASGCGGVPPPSCRCGEPESGSGSGPSGSGGSVGASCFDGSDCQSGICRFSNPNDPTTGTCTTPSNTGAGSSEFTDGEISGLEAACVSGGGEDGGGASCSCSQGTINSGFCTITGTFCNWCEGSLNPPGDCNIFGAGLASCSR